MGSIWDGFVEAFKLIFGLDPTVIRITLFTLYVCGIATFIGMVIGIPFGSWLAFARFPGRRFMVALINTGMALPPVVVGLYVYQFFRRNGPFGFLGWLYTPKAIILAEVVLAMPLIAGIVLSTMQNTDPKLRWQARSLSGSRLRANLTLLRENRIALMTAVMAGFGAIISEVGAAMMVGGNLVVGGVPYTQTLTTRTVQAVSMGETALANALGIILLSITLLLMLAMTWLQQRDPSTPGVFQAMRRKARSAYE